MEFNTWVDLSVNYVYIYPTLDSPQLLFNFHILNHYYNSDKDKNGTVHRR